jgi:hypothetical protein
VVAADKAVLEKYLGVVQSERIIPRGRS